ncbi:MAG: ferritin-like domain-containing protein [Solirubrobacterales bacterium]
MRPESPLYNPVSRRRLMQACGLTIAGGSAAFVAACGDEDSGETDEAGDARALNVALAFAYAGTSAYKQTAALLGPTQEIGDQFAKQEQEHATAIASAIGDLGGTPVRPKTDSEYAQALGLGKLKTEPEALAFLVEFEQMAIYAWLDAVPKITNHDLRTVAGEIAANGAQHVSVLVGVQSGNDPEEQSPQAFVTGAKPTVKL